MPKCHSITVHHLGNHGIDGHRLFQLIVLHQRQGVKRHRIQQRGLTDFILIKGGEGFENLLQKTTLDGFALQAQIAHGFKKGILLDVTGGPISHFKQRIIGTVEQSLQGLLELLGSLVTHLSQRHGQSSYRRNGRVLRGDLIQAHHVRISHCESPAERATKANHTAQRSTGRRP